MMITTRRPALSPLLLSALLALPAAPLWAVPVYMQAAAPQERPAQQAEQQGCLATVRAQLRTSDGREMEIGRVRRPQAATPDWRDGTGGSWSARAYAALHGQGKAEFDAWSGACRLANSDTTRHSRINDGVDLTELLQTIDEWLALNPVQEDQDRQAALDQPPERLHLALGADQQLPVPEPSSYAMLLAGLGLLALLRRRAR